MEHYLTLKYRGLLADENRMDAADRPVAGDGAKQVLAAMAYAYCYGDVPRNKLTDNRNFYIHSTADKIGSYEVALVVGILGSAIYDVAKYSFFEYAVPTYQAWLEDRYFNPPEFARIEPHFERVDGGNAPIFDNEPAQAKLRTDLGRALDGGTVRMTRPIGRFANNLSVALDGQAVASFSQRHRPKIEKEIEAALLPIRAKRTTTAYH